MPIERRERPNCRRIVEKLLRERGCTLQDLIAGNNKFGISEALRIQTRKMIEEAARGPAIK